MKNLNLTSHAQYAMVENFSNRHNLDFQKENLLQILRKERFEFSLMCCANSIFIYLGERILHDFPNLYIPSNGDSRIHECIFFSWSPTEIENWEKEVSRKLYLSRDCLRTPPVSFPVITVACNNIETRYPITYKICTNFIVNTINELRESLPPLPPLIHL